MLYRQGSAGDRAAVFIWSKRPDATGLGNAARQRADASLCRRQRANRSDDRHPLRNGLEHVVVVYGEGGRVLADYELEDLIDANEIRQHVPHTVSSRWWTRDATFSFHELSHLVITLSWGRVITIDLATGAIVPKLKVNRPSRARSRQCVQQSPDLLGDRHASADHHFAEKACDPFAGRARILDRQ